MQVWRIVTLSMMLMLIVGPFVPALAAWLPTATGVLAIAVLAVAAYGLVEYFEWRGRLKSRSMADQGRDDGFAMAA